MIHSKIISYKDLLESKRFDCAFLINYLDTEEILNNSKYSSKELVDPEITLLITDGEHQPLNRMKDGEYRYLYGRNIKEGFVNFDDVSDLPYISKEEYEQSKRIQGRDGDVLLAIKGTVGKSAVFYKSYIGDAALPREVAKIVTKNSLKPEYLCIFLLSQYGRMQTTNSGSGNIHKLLTLTRLRKIKIVTPPISLQEEISYLYKEAINKEVKALDIIKNTKKYIESEIQRKLGIEYHREKIFNISFNKLEYFWTPEYYKPLYINTISLMKKKIDCVQLKDLASIRKGDEVGSSNYRDYFNKLESDVPFVRTTDIVNYEIDNYPDYYIDNNIYEELEQNVESGDIIFSNDGKIGLSGLILDFDKCILQSHIRYIRSFGKVPQFFLFTFFLSKFAQYYFRKNTVIQSTIPTIRDALEYLPIPILDDKTIKVICVNIQKAFKLKNEKKNLISEAKFKLKEILSN